MSFITINNVKLHYQFNDFGQKDILLFSNSLGTNLSMWDYQVDGLKNHFNILRHDTRGHGKSELGEYSAINFDILGNDVIALLDHLKIEKAHFIGLSMGGLTGQWLGINAASRFKTITIANTAAKIGNAEGWNSRIEQIKKEGLASISEATASRWFTGDFIKNNPLIIANILHNFENTNLKGYLANCKAVRDADFRATLQNITVPTLVISGSEDPVTTVEEGKFMADQMPVSTHITVNAAHLSNIEQAEEFTKAILYHAKLNDLKYINR